MPASPDSSRKLSLRPHPHLYEINTWAWLEALSRREGRKLSLAEVPDRDWDEFARLGFDLVWLMGVWQRSPLGRRIAQTDSQLFPLYEQALPGWRLDQVVGSPYSICDYSPDPRIGVWRDIDTARQKLHSRNIGLILDFIPNHTGLDHLWVAAHPEYYIQGTAQDFRENPSFFYLCERGGEEPWVLARARDPYFPPWRDLAQLNLFQPAAHAALLAELQNIAQHCDGVRCDTAMLLLTDEFSKTWSRFLTGFPPPPREFWRDAASAAPRLILLAEVYWGMERRLQTLGFDFTYCKGFYDVLREGRPDDIRAHFTADLDYQKRAVHFLENHDEARSAAVFGPEKLPAVGALLATAPGLRMYHQGQLEGRKIRLPIELAEAANEPPDPATAFFYAKILQISNQDIFHAGEWTLLAVESSGDSTADNLIVYQWRSKTSWKLVAVNLTGVTSQGSVQIAAEITPTTQYTLRDELNNAVYEWHGSDIARDGLYVRLAACAAQIFDITPL
jgi:hypothetical protein